MEHKTLSLSNCDIKLKGDTFAGYASTFNNVDSYGDTILPGAYDETLKANGLPKMFLQHDSYALPIGKWLKAQEDEVGLWVEGEFTPNMNQAENAKAALNHGTVDGLSIGFMLRKSDYKPSDKVEGGRIIERVSKLIEVSLVTFPADTFARVDMKSEIEELETIRDFERFLRDSGAFSKSTAQLLISKARALFGDQKADSSDELKQILNHINSKGVFKCPN